MSKRFYNASEVPDEQTWMYEDVLPGGHDAARALLQNYSRIPAGDVDAHIRRIRDELWNVFHYPCIGRWRFLLLADSQNQLYRQVLRRLTDVNSQDGLLDLGTCVGQALRQLTHDGADSSRLFGVDLRPEFLDIGYDLFQDKGRFHATLVAGNVLDPADANLTALNGRVSIVWANASFHLFDWKQQVAAATRIVGFLRPGIRDALVFGRHLGSVEPKESEDRGRTRFLHDQGSFQRLWDDWSMWPRWGCRFRVTATRHGRATMLCIRTW
ncbi:Methyltransferase ausD [Colletotrichum spinosum]|uniref:Methyltransferase ausD n=1 Tax=Colletotrichum spinosum TaxID=1347390 RepID=A0A4R8PXG0_9PEZI|nr:Methyltransferase ausD [Colletotrichum spinosum]